MLAIYLAGLDDTEDKNTFRGFYLEHRQLMYRVALKVLKDRHLAEDAVQEAFVSILPHTGRLREMDKGQKEGFAVVVARNKAIDLLRKKNRVSSWEDVDEKALAVEMETEETVPVLDQLPFLYAQVMKLVGLGFRPGEIAEMTDREVGTVYKQIARGRELLREILEKEGYRGA